MVGPWEVRRKGIQWIRHPSGELKGSQMIRKEKSSALGEGASDWEIPRNPHESFSVGPGRIYQKSPGSKGFVEREGRLEREQVESRSQWL